MRTGCKKSRDFYLTEEVFECENCGNHVCKKCYILNGGLCPNCLGILRGMN